VREIGAYGGGGGGAVSEGASAETRRSHLPCNWEGIWNSMRDASKWSFYMASVDGNQNVEQEQLFALEV
jgi:hypothetical protein